MFIHFRSTNQSSIPCLGAGTSPDDRMHFCQPWAFSVQEEVHRLRREVDDMAAEIAKLKRLITSTSST
ncbi:unnamed protein product [Eruca vesicaria subsp. sativa]|uniref:Uncharacterized protein n=1 Tax=Eruca vesicaria subsp. sativa TaxID=29727 RepID=A0ABC8K9D2_ERUVS|nr:unnamed protein product [Eruca vesicaria subsp. sativa]